MSVFSIQSINQSKFVLLPAKPTAETAATEVSKTRVRSLLSRTKVGVVNYGRIMQITMLPWKLQRNAHISNNRTLALLYDDVYIVVISFFHFQELSPTSDTALVKGLMNFIDCLTDEFHDEAKMSILAEKESCAWIEVCLCFWRDMSSRLIWFWH